MVNRSEVKPRVIEVLDILSPLHLSEMNDVLVETIKIGYTSGFDDSTKKVLAVPLTKIAREFSPTSFRIVSQAETSELKTIAGAIDLTLSAANGQPYDGE